MVANNGSIATNGTISIGHLITLNIHVLRENFNQAMQFDVQMFVGDVLRSIQGHLPIRIDQDRKIYIYSREITILRNGIF